MSRLTDQIATDEFGWTQAEFGDSDQWLNTIRLMLVREAKAILNGTANAATYGYDSEKLFLKDNRSAIAKIDEALGI